jgi:hypothetical protein
LPNKFNPLGPQKEREKREKEKEKERERAGM